MTKEEAKKMGATHYRNMIFFKQYFAKNTENNFWYVLAEPFWFFYDSEKPCLLKPL